MIRGRVPRVRSAKWKVVNMRKVRNKILMIALTCGGVLGMLLAGGAITIRH